MKAERFIVSLLGIALTGCGSSITAIKPIAATQDLTGNWQIQSGDTHSSTLGILLLGSLQGSDNNVRGTFRFSNLAQPTSCGLNQVVTLTGSIDAAQNLVLTSSPLPNGNIINLQLLVSPSPTGIDSGTIAVTGAACAFSPSAAIGARFASVTGTFAGTLTPGTFLLPTAGTPGTGSLVLAQSSVPSADGQFPVTGTLAYTVGACSATVALTGDASGVGITLAVAPPAQSVPGGLNVFTFLGTIAPTAAQITASFTVFPAPCSTNPLTSASYTGTFIRS